MPGDFDKLTPERFLDAAEAALGERLGGYASAFPSYVNRVYEIETLKSKTRLVAKFYRPGRWSREAIEEEHRFVLECAAEEIPVVPPMTLANNSTLAESEDGILFAIYPKRRGRQSEFESEESLKRVGSLLARMHTVGARRPAPSRIEMRPCVFGEGALNRLFDSGAAQGSFAEEFHDVSLDVIDASEEIFPDASSFIRIHGDFHQANVLDRLEEGLIAIDFDDMANGPAVQDLWLLLPGAPKDFPVETNAILEGYSQFMDFDDSSLRLVEPLRAMRMLHYLSWCALQLHDKGFSDNFPDWGSDSFWRRETADMRRQLQLIEGEH